MNDSENSIGRRIKMILGTLGIFVVFGFLALILSGFAGNESPEDRAYKGEFSEEIIETRWKNLEEVETAQSEVYDEAKVNAAMEKIMSSVAEPKKTGIVVPGSPTFLKQSEQPAAPAEGESSEPAPEDSEEKQESNEGVSPGIKPAAPGSAAPKEEQPKPGPVNAPESNAKPKGAPKEEGAKEPKGDAPKGGAPKGDTATKAEAPAKPAPAPANQ